MQTSQISGGDKSVVVKVIVKRIWNERENTLHYTCIVTKEKELTSYAVLINSQVMIAPHSSLPAHTDICRCMNTHKNLFFMLFNFDG